MKIAIVGSRDYPDLNKVREFVRSCPKDSCIISGGARGVDSIAEQEAKLLGLETIIFHPDWDKFGKSAGFKRNVQIVSASDKVVAFWDGESKGTLHSINLAKQLKKELVVIK